MIRRIYIAGIILFLISQISHAEVSFDCEIDNLNIVELEICGSAELRNLDGLMATLFSKIKKYGITAAIDEQKVWLRDRNTCGENSWCIDNRYRSRISELAKILKLDNPQHVTSPELFTTLNWIADSPFDKSPTCEKYDDINLDGRKEIVCWPYCGGPACAWYFFASINDIFRYLPELEQGTANELSVLPENMIPEHILNKYPVQNGNVINGWRILYSKYTYQDIFEESYFCYSKDRYIPC
ncbi:lysozyme inhibitor LprI family protein [Cellvibrio sp. PSBB006]|uniref:lysozyme inhibitor LprI family protein n=1 Tax=Cellvibrio sp. PSBB006 TaxID=1987723 RepID=UPI000B3B3FAB|nr:hypothetical protein [Cellvibrio sp. PSBB006]ARU28685.1 hypothetical protein CBR65_15210 [Cellvibrio sp. PSBB006]